MTIEVLGWYASIFVWLFATGIGIPPMPEEAGILYAASVASLHPEVWWPFAWLTCGLGILCADCVLYGLGRWWGPRLFAYKWVQRFLSEDRRKQLEERFHAHGMKLLILARFLPPLRTGVFLISGASRYSFVKFLIADGIYCVFGVGLVFFFGAGLLAVVKEIGYKAAWIAAIPLVLYGLYRYFKFLEKRDQGPVPPVSILQHPAGAAGEKLIDPAGVSKAVQDVKTTLHAPAGDA